MKVVLFFVFVLAASVFAQGNLPTLILIDDFTVGENQQSVTVSLDADLSINDPPVFGRSSFTENGCTGLIGCSRDMQIEVQSGFVGRDFTSDIFRIPGDDTLFDAEWVISNPKGSRSVCSIQYDGPDESFNLDVGGLGGLDFTVGDAIFISALSDLPAEYIIRVYDRDGGRCEADIDVAVLPGDYNYSETFFELDLDDFDRNGCDLTDVGAVEFFLPSDDAVDAIVKRIALIGEEPTVTPTPPPTQSPTPPPSVEIPPPECHCHCPIFTCALIFDPDDDENNAYYFDDDDEGERVGSNGSVNYYFLESSSPASVLQTSFMVVALVAVLVF